MRRFHPHGHRGTLQRRLFLWFGGALLLVTLLVAAIAHFWQQRQSTSFGGGADFVAARFAERWEDEAARRELADELANTMNVAIELHDPNGGVLLQTDGSCEGYGLRGVARRGGTLLGTVQICKVHRRDDLLRGVVLVAVFLLGMWLVVGRIAVWLSWPLKQTAELAKKIGDGDLTARLAENRRDLVEVRMFKTALNEMAARVEAHHQDQKLLLASVSHEIRTPLGHARLLIDQARDHGLKDKAADELESEVLVIDDLVGQLLAGGKLDAIGAELQEVDGAAIARRALEAFDEHALTHEDDVTLRADPTLLLRALTNLIRNANDHGDGLDSVDVSVRGADVCFRVSDHGAGLTPKELAHLITPYARSGGPDRRALDNADSRGSLGLGLSLTARIAHAHDGTLTAENGNLVLRLPRSGPTSSPRTS